MKKKNKIKDGINVRGFFRLRIGEPDISGKIVKCVGDTGWIENTVTNLGKDQYLAQSLAGMAGSKHITYAAIGSGTAPGAADTTLDGELVDASNCRCAVSPTTVNQSGTVQFAFTLNSNIITASKAAISNVGLFNTSAVTVGTLFAGNTFSSSALQTDQVINGSYQIQF